MSDSSAVLEIDRPPAEVYAYVTDPLRFPRWQLDVVSVTPAVPGPIGLGSRFTTVRRIGSADRATTQEITDLVPGVSWAARGVDGPIRPDATVTVTSLDGGARTRLTLTLTFRGSGLGVALLPLVRKAAAKGAPLSHANLKRLLDSHTED
ncbi:SRPBCC family protein [Catellatospora tritici]|uniref:SRPBCC family protein n=1 Tax=Catellatospora tritici TaxID=2851566 RepID=UPI001C2D1055|nr:SRPBCC family protein [Catellatospora tritici]MBV1852260.1 SRPBCC family protein [Catellatospora tritici]